MPTPRFPASQKWPGQVMPVEHSGRDARVMPRATTRTLLRRDLACRFEPGTLLPSEASRTANMFCDDVCFLQSLTAAPTRILTDARPRGGEPRTPRDACSGDGVKERHWPPRQGEKGPPAWAATAGSLQFEGAGSRSDYPRCCSGGCSSGDGHEIRCARRGGCYDRRP